MLSLMALAGSVKIGQLRCEHLENPIGIGMQQPRLSWKLQSDRVSEVQTAFQIRAGLISYFLTVVSLFSFSQSGSGSVPSFQAELGASHLTDSTWPSAKVSS